MLTLKKLKALFKTPASESRPPTAKSLRESNESIVVQNKLSHDAEVIVYHSGYVLYRSGRRNSVFHVHDCGDYKYGVSEDMKTQFQESYFDDHEWHLRIVLEGEDKLEHNQNKRETDGRVSYSAIAEDWSELADHTIDILGGLISKEGFRNLLHCLTEKQKQVVYHHIVLGKPQYIIAEEFGIDATSVNKIFQRGIRRIAKKYDFELNYGAA